ncbi:hypothetical protein NARC_10413 [Candidatus Nitrosocosmicus arcticus]|uniref:Uncharacterized protein n=1 Tax=Candidatus Nitrosocosmicus arcticus TaxID=2035267 RepID=A0A557SZH6_9ARCH|nr:hypothetical protein NARC_10413 [Candidatus Nitrosocosmicus arcticus]
MIKQATRTLVSNANFDMYKGFIGKQHYCTTLQTVETHLPFQQMFDSMVIFMNIWEKGRYHIVLFKCD